MYHFYMGSVLLPVAPKKFKLKVNNQNETLTLINEGEVNFLRKAGLTDLEFEVIIPAVEYSFAKYDGGFKSPDYYLSHFEKLKNKKKAFQFVAVREMPNGKPIFDTDMKVSLEDYTVEENADEGFDLTVSIKLKQYNSSGTKIVTVTSGSATVTTKRETANSPAPTQGKPHTVKKGECLWGIAKYYYDDGSKYPKIYEANKALLDERNNKYGQPKYTIYPNQVLVIPAL